MPFFSIIIPTYNRAHTIKKPIDSILSQTITDWELIIVDDGSTDGTKDIIDSYNDLRIRYIWQENQKESAARNHGISLAKGAWICFQDSDDEYLPNHLQVLYDAIHQYSEYKVIRTGLLVYNNGVLVSKSGTESSKYDQYPYECFQTCTFHSSIFKKVLFDQRFHIVEDLHFLVRVGKIFEFKVIDLWTGIYHYDPGSSGGVGSNYERNLENRKLCLDDILFWNESLIQPYLRRARCLAELLLLFGHLTFNKGKILSGLKENINIFSRFPMEYIKLVLRILYVKLGESSGLYRTQGRF